MSTLFSEEESPRLVTTASAGSTAIVCGTPAHGHAMGRAPLVPPHVVSSHPPWRDLFIIGLCNILARDDWASVVLLGGFGRNCEICDLAEGIAEPCPVL